MRRYSPQYYSPPRRGYGGGGRVRSRSPPPRRGHGGGGRRREQNSGSLLVRNIPIDVRPEELRVPFERFGVVRDVYIPKDYHTGGSATRPALRKLVFPFLEPRGFAFVQFVDSRDAMEAHHRMNGQVFAGREISVVVALETRKRPEEMRHRTSRDRAPSGYGGRSSNYGRSWSRSPSRNHPDSRRRNRSRSYSPAPRRRDYSASPVRRHAEDNRSHRGPPERDGNPNGRTYSPGYARRDNARETADGYREKRAYDHEEAREWRPSPRRSSRSPSGSRSRSAEE